MKRAEFMRKAEKLKLPAPMRRRDGRCADRGCVFPAHAKGLCLLHLRDSGQTFSYATPVSAEAYDQGTFTLEEFLMMRATD